MYRAQAEKEIVTEVVQFTVFKKNPHSSLSDYFLFQII